MSKSLLKASPSNLPTYVYDLTADIAFVHHDGVFKLKYYSFTYVRVVVNQPLRKGDSLCTTAYYPGNSNIEIIPHLKKKGVLNGAENELRYYIGCIITSDIQIRYSPGEYKHETCGDGSCTVFIELSACETGDKWRSLDNFGTFSEITKEHREAWQIALDDYDSYNKIERWKERVGDWDNCVEYIGSKDDFFLLY